MKSSYSLRIPLIFLLVSLLISGLAISVSNAQPSEKNPAIVATPSSSVRYDAPVNSLNDGLTPVNINRQRSGGNRPPQKLTSQWIQYDWSQPVSTGEINVFWWNYENAVKLPKAYRLKYWDGNDFILVRNVSGL